MQWSKNGLSVKVKSSKLQFEKIKPGQNGLLEVHAEVKDMTDFCLKKNFTYCIIHFIKAGSLIFEKLFTNSLNRVIFCDSISQITGGILIN
jgi:hypothetical protein